LVIFQQLRFVLVGHRDPVPLGAQMAAQELELLTRDYTRLVREQTRLLNQLIATLKEDIPPGT